MSAGAASLVVRHAERRVSFKERMRWDEGNEHEACYVVSGSVELFAVPRGTGGSPRGAGTWLCKIPEGGLFFFISGQDEERVEVTAVAAPETELAVLPVRTANRLAAGDEAFRSEWVSLIERWIAVVGAAAAPPLPPKDIQWPERDVETVVWQDAAFAAESSVLWAEPLVKPLIYWNEPFLPAIAPGEVGPLSRDIWAGSARGNRFRVYATTEVCADGKLPDALIHFHRLVATRLIHAHRERRRREVDRLMSRHWQNRAFMTQAMRRLSTAAESRGRSLLLAGEGADDPLFACCRLVASRMGLTVRFPESKGEKPGTHPEERFRSAGLRYRKVALRSGWHREDHGPLLGFREDGTPIALLPTPGGNGYEAWEAGGHAPVKVTEETARGFHPFAYEFYRTLPDRPIGWKDFGAVLLTPRIRWDMARGILYGLMSGLLGLALPVAAGLMVERLIPVADEGQLIQMLLLLLAVGFASFGITVSQSAAWLRIFGTLGASLQSAVWDRLLKMPAAFARRFTAGDLVSRVNGIDRFFGVLSNWVMNGMAVVLFSTLHAVLLFVYWPGMAWLAVALVAGYILLFVSLSFPAARLTVKKSEEEGKVGGLVVGLLNGVPKFKAAAAEPRAFFHWSRHFSAQQTYAFKLRELQAVLQIIAGAYPLLAMLLLFWLSVKDGLHVGAGTFVAFYTSFTMFITAVVELCSSTIPLYELIPLSRRIRPLLAEQPEAEATRTHPGLLTGAIEIHRVTFRYAAEGEPVLKDVSLHIRPGEYVAIVGTSGSGKSTLLRLMIGFETPESGTVFYDGKELNSLDLREVRRQCGVVLQNGRLWPGDIAQNIIGQGSDLTPEDAWEALQAVGLAEEIERLPMGIHTVLTGSVDVLSGGQKQRILIARAIVHKPRILFLDEATSALDQVSQEKITDLLVNMNATRIVIAHRLSTVMKADRIVVMDQGRIVEQGTYEELLRRGGLFERLARRQVI